MPSREPFGMDTAKQQYWLNASVAARSSAAVTTTNEIFTPPRRLLTLSHRSLAASSTPANASAAANARPPNEVNQRNLGLGPTILTSSLHLDVDPSGITCYMYYIATQQIIDETAASSISYDVHPPTWSSFGRDKVSQQSFKTLNPALWLTFIVLTWKIDTQLFKQQLLFLQLILLLKLLTWYQRTPL